METRQQLYHLLEQMVQSAENNEPTKVSALHEQYKELHPKVYSNPMTKLDFEYDNCRNACFSSVGILRSINESLAKDAKGDYVEILKQTYENLVQDARERFDNLPKP